MPAVNDLVHQASNLRSLLSTADESDVLAHADELLLFLNRLRDFLSHGSRAPIPISSLNDIIQRFESNPVLTLKDKITHEHLLNLFMKL
jgi:hypothetical protein